jgi:coenzyme Q-binding protein COQ10
MPRHHETRQLPYSAEAMFDLVADVARYSEFLPWVVAVRVRENSDTAMVADLVVGFKGLRESFTSRVNKQRAESIRVDYIDGPLKHLHNEWRFTPIPTGCEVDFVVDFAFRNSLFERLAGQMFDRALRKMIGAFEARADAPYRAPVTGASIAVGSNRPSANSVA